MLTYSFDNVDVPLYEYIYKRIREDILNGTIPPGTRLPSKRTFAKNNGISTITIQNAYDQLISEGYIITSPRRGYFVADIKDIPGTPRTGSVNLEIKLPAERIFPCEVDLADNRTAPDNFPFSVWNRIIREIISTRGRDLMQPSFCAGVRELREAIASYLISFRGMLVDPNQIVVGAGTDYLYGLIIQLLGRERVVCLESPGYSKPEKVYRANSVRCCYAGVDENGIDIDDLRRTPADVVHLSPTHHFPSGVTMPVTRRYQILAWANEKDGRYIIEDDYDSEFRINGKPLTPLFGIDAGEKVIYINTFSKSLASTVRISYMILPEHLANKFYRMLSFYSCTVSNFEQYTLAEFIKKGYFEKHINRMRLYYSRKRRDILKCIAESSMSTFCEVVENDSGLHFLLKIKTDIRDEELTLAMASKGINLRPLSGYYLNGEEKDLHLFIINYSNLDVNDVKKAMDTIYEYITDFRKII